MHVNCMHYIKASANSYKNTKATEEDDLTV